MMSTGNKLRCLKYIPILEITKIEREINSSFNRHINCYLAELITKKVPFDDYNLQRIKNAIEVQIASYTTKEEDIKNKNRTNHNYSIFDIIYYNLPLRNKPILISLAHTKLNYPK